MKKADTLCMMHEVVEVCLKVCVAFTHGDAGQAMLKQQESMGVYVHSACICFYTFSTVFEKYFLYESCYRQFFFIYKEFKPRQL